jgi:putative peptide zinc metalloprotease protein
MEQAAPQTRHGQPALLTEVPERPALAPRVQLIGKMPETGFQDQQWLIQRDGRFIQTTELLYRVAEQMNGERTLEEIAEKVTEATDWLADADDVKQLIQMKFIPLGLIPTADELSTSRLEATREGRSSSPLAFTLNMEVLSPRVIDPLTRILQVLYEPLILISVLITAGIAHWWLYRVHDITRSVHETIYTPGGLLLVLAIVALAALFHEFGHAAALRYGGGKVRGMGMGLYLIYPAFYTDVTDSYRLGRWARVRTDLGGVYFHSIFALTLIMLPVDSGKELLLFAALLINVDMLRQFVPFVRFDGYWALADLTGIPDFFSQMGPFVRSVLTVPGSKEGRLPALKPWVKAVFVTYIVGTVPILAYLFFIMVKTLPELLATTWDTLLKLIGLFSSALSRGAYLTVGLWGMQMVLLSVPILGTFYIIYTVTRVPIKALWNWGKPTTARRAAGALTPPLRY